jgi:cytochrome b involved in lipid metabolism
MGWIRQSLRSQARSTRGSTFEDDPRFTPYEELKAVTEHIESVSLAENETPGLQNTKSENKPNHGAPSKYHKQLLDIPDKDLPLIAPSEITLLAKGKSDKEFKLWLVIDDVVYDCSEFVAEHPGGEQVIQSFRGHDCSWQFWRFHSKEHLEEHGRPLRIGRTTGIQNPFAEPERWVGLRRLYTQDDWSW